MSTDSESATDGSDADDGPPRTLEAGDDERIELVFRDERVADDQTFVMPDAHDGSE
ncbi:MAG: hypothetical protein ABEI99_10505 [Halobaculum sp.]